MAWYSNAMRWVVIVSLSLLCSAIEGPTPAAAQDPYGCIADLEEAELDARLRMVDRRLQQGKLGARLWWYGWQAIFGGVVAFQAISWATADSQSERWATAIGTVGGSLALAQMWILPNPGAYAPQRYRRMPTDTRAQREAKLRYGLDRIEVTAKRERLGRGVMAHGLPILWSAVWGTTLSVKFDDPPRIAMLIVGGFLVTQARIWTTPQRAVRDWDEIRWNVCEHRFARPGTASRRRDEQVAEGEEAAPRAGSLPASTETGPQVQVAPFFGGGQLIVTF